jgi:hypothetical protein
LIGDDQAANDVPRVVAAMQQARIITAINYLQA